ncbi:hypothetical protein [Rubinisphaera sp. JC750]|uniref:hypothetical protein n=1 Tax=Rubinisphaera sp. JC750 TaxID=2898658 RepID=UPI001F2C8CCB|nr:hypothetical protein [Rubinisphaera sp. JC750]
MILSPRNFDSMFVLLTKYLVCGMMLTHSLLGCHAHHVADLCCSAAMGQMQQLWLTDHDSEDSMRPVAACHCAHKHTASTEINTAAADIAQAPHSEPLPAPVSGCCSEHECVYLQDAEAPELIDLMTPVSEMLESLLAELTAQPSSHFNADLLIAESDSPAQLRARLQIWRL